MRIQRIPGLGPRGGRRLIDSAGSPEAVFSDSDLPARCRLRPDLAAALKDPRHLRAAHAEADYALGSGIRCLSYRNPEYPGNLTQCEDAPLMTFLKGNIQPRANNWISVVGTRKITSYGRSFCEALIAGLAPIQPTIVSGFAIGVDICAHRAAMQYGLPTLACMAHGLDRIYPAAHRRYVRDVMEHGGFLTEFWRGTLPVPGMFLRRNRVIAGLSSATIVIESDVKGGSLITADFAFGYNREVFAVPGRIGEAASAGCNMLIRQQKAQLIRNAGDVLEALGWTLPNASAARSDQEGGPKRVLPDDLEEAELEIARYLLKHGTSGLDGIAIGCKRAVSEAAAALFALEMKGLVRPMPGKMFTMWPGLILSK